MKELSLSGWELTNSLRGYVRETGQGGNWRDTIASLEYFENHHDKNGEVRELSPDTENMIAAQWIRESFEEGIRWFTEEIERDYANPDDVKNVVSVLSTVPLEDQDLVVDWVQSQQGNEGWNDDVSVNLGRRLMKSPPNENTERLVALISDEADRVQFVTSFVGRSSVSSSKFGLRHSPESLNLLVDAARLSEANTDRFKEVIAAGVWKGSK